MSQPALIRFNDVSKRFTLAHARTQGLLQNAISRVKDGLRRSADPRNELWAVRNVSFDVARGESVGLIGHNGSGKSTLLKLATRILKPTSGNVAVTGRISALLELGAGFHEDLTGRENIYLNGSVMGLSREEIDQRFDAIVDFSELEPFIDVPVKHYSSGMYMRLGFSVAVHCEPDVLLIDEILGVGDGAFQGKCTNRIYELRQRGVTIIMVSHQISTLRKLCDSLVWMDHGVMREKGEVNDLSVRYIDDMNDLAAQKNGGSYVINRSGSMDAEITSVRFLDAGGHEKTIFKTGDAMTMEMQYVAHRPIARPEMGFAIFTGDTQLSGDNNRVAGCEIESIDGKGTLRYEIESLPLLPGTYNVSAAIHDSQMPLAYDYHRQAYEFQIEADDDTRPQGVINFAAAWRTA